MNMNVSISIVIGPSALYFFNLLRFNFDEVFLILFEIGGSVKGNRVMAGSRQSRQLLLWGFKRPKLQPLDQSIHTPLKTHDCVLYGIWNQRKPSRQSNGGFMKDLEFF